MLDLPLAYPEIDLLIGTEKFLEQQQQRESKYLERSLVRDDPRDSC